MSDLTPGSSRNLFGYDVISVIGRGAGSTIYAVNDAATGQVYALKHVVRTQEKDIRYVEQLQREYDVARDFTHPGLRRSLDLKICRTLLRRVTEAALVMELFDGEPLGQSLPDSVGEIVDIMSRSAHAVHALHEMGLVHCDFKPNNILVGSGRQVKIIDFGQTCPSGTVKRRIQGTPDFIAPEQVKCRSVSARTDIFSFGATLYWALSHRKLPTLITSRSRRRRLVIDEAIPTPHQLNPQVPESLSSFTMDCARTEPSNRPASMAAVAYRLESILHGLETPASSAAIA